MNTYLVEAFVWDMKGGSVKSYIIFADNSQQAADKCRKYEGAEYDRYDDDGVSAL